MANENRLIDANALLHEYCQANGCNEVNDEVCPNCFAAGLIAEAPTVDAVEVVHGHWIEKPYLLGTTRYCSICGQNYGMPHGVFNYCPNCGADMRERKDND